MTLNPNAYYQVENDFDAAFSYHHMAMQNFTLVSKPKLQI